MSLATRRTARPRAAAPRPATPRPPDVWRTLLRGSPVFIPAILSYTGVQFLLLLPRVTPAVTPLFLSMVAAAFLVNVFLVAIASFAATAAARGTPLTEVFTDRPGRRVAEVVGWAAVWIAAVSFAAVFQAILAGVLLLLGAAVMPAVVNDRGFRGWLIPLRHAPVLTLVWGAGCYALLVLSAVADAEIGFLLTGPFGAAVARIVTGIIGAVILSSSAVVFERADARRAAHRAAASG